MHSTTNTLKIITVLLLLFHKQVARGSPQDIVTESPRNGRYVPELHGADRGKYVPDESGKYHHVLMPYDGGYGDRGLGYVHDERALPPPPPPRLINGLSLGPKDHLRFAIDFNYDSSGWQIVQFDWVNDDDDKISYDYKYQNQLWGSGGDSSASGQSYAGKVDETSPTNSALDQMNTNVHVSGEYQDDIYNVNYSNDNKLNAPNQANIQATIGEVLEYIQTNVLPTLK